MDESFSIENNPINIPDNAFLEFQQTITPEIIYEFYNESQKYTEKEKSIEKSHKISKSNFISICKKIFPESNNPHFSQIFSLIFERFKEKKCIFTMNASNMYVLSDIVSTGKIEVYVMELFLCIIMQTEFKKKIEIMFYVTDSDSDGLINEREIKKLILTTNKMFYEGPLELFSGSTLVQQSLSNIKANKILSILLYGPGELNKKFAKCKYISFEQFYDSITKMDNYKYTIIPTFINLKNCLMTQRKEMEFKMNSKYQKDFLKITYEILNSNGNQNSARTLLKKCFDQKQIKKKKILDPLKEIKAKKQKEKELKLRRSIQIKKDSQNLSSKSIHSKFKININENEKKAIENSINKINNDQNIISYSDRKKSNFNAMLKFVSIDKLDMNKNKNKSCNLINKINNINNEDNSNIGYNYIYSTRKETSCFTPNNKDKKLDLEKEGIKQIKYSSIASKKIIKIPRKGILRPSSENASMSQQSFILNKSNSNTTVNKMVSFSDELDLKNSQSQQNLNNEATQFNMNKTNLLNLDKIKSEQMKVNLKNSLFSKIKSNNNSNSYKKLKTFFRRKTSAIKHSKNNSFLSRRNTMRKDEILNNKKIMEKGDYYKFTSMIFPPCVIKSKDKDNKDKDEYLTSSFRKKGSFSLKLKKQYFNMSKINEMNKSDCLFKSFEELKNDINCELEHEIKSDFHVVDEILKLNKYVDEKKENFPYVDLSQNKIEPKNLIINSYFYKNKKKKYL